MKPHTALSMVVLTAVAATALVSGPASAAPVGQAGSDAETSVTATQPRLRGKFVTDPAWSTGFHGWAPRGSSQWLTHPQSIGTGGPYGLSYEAALAAAATATFPAVGTSGRIEINGQCLTTDRGGTRTDLVRVASCSSASTQYTLAADGFLTDPSGRRLNVLGVGTKDMQLGFGPNNDADVSKLVMSQLVPDLSPSASVPTPSLRQGESVQVQATFNTDAGGQRIDIVPPLGTRITAVANPAFALDGTGAGGTLPIGTTAVTFTLTADADARLGLATGGSVSWSTNRVKLADFTANVLAAPIAPGVTIPNVTVRQGDAVEVPVAFTESVSGSAEIVVPAGLRPTGDAPAGFTWYPASNSYRGTITAANRSFTLALTANADAAVGVFDGAVRATGIDQVWTATIEAGAPVPDAPVVLLSPAIGGVLEPGAPVFSGTGQPGALIQVYGAWGSLLGETRVETDATWTLTWNKALTPGTYSGGSVRQYLDGKPFTSVPYDFRVDWRVAPLVVTSPSVGAIVLETNPVFTGTAQPGAAIEIRGASGDLLGAVDRVADDGRWTITWNKTLLPARYVGGTVRQFVDGEQTHSVVYDFTVVVPRLEVVSPALGGTIAGTRPVFSGHANPGALIKIRGAWGTDLGSITAGPQGDWSITWPSDYLPARYSGGTVTEAVGGTVVRTLPYDFTLVR